MCDLGGWTDTWFAGHGLVVSVAIQLYAYAAVERTGAPGVRLDVPDLPTDDHPLLRAAIEEAGADGCHVTVWSDAPPGSSIGTSAAVVVALLAALGVPKHELAERAHRVETERLGRQSGVQDQYAAVHGGVNAIVIDGYPHVSVEPIGVPPGLEGALHTFYLGRPHESSRVHEQVIDRLDATSHELETLREVAARGRAAMEVGDLAGLGAAMRANTAAQRALHPALVSTTAEAIGRLADAHGALGWKVNGAGGSGGSVTVLGGDGDAITAAVVEALPTVRPLIAGIDREGVVVRAGTR